MLRVVLVVVLVFFLLTVLRGLRIFLAAFLKPTGPGAQRQGAPRDGEMVRDPICGTWIDRRLAVMGRQGGQPVPVCSEQCRTRLEAS